MHYFGKFQDSMIVADPLFAGHGQGYTRAPLVNHATGSVLTGLSVCEIAPGGTLDPHVHSFEEGFYVLSGGAVFACNDQAYRLTAGDYGVVKVGGLHAWRNTGSVPVRWLQMNAPQPKPAGRERDTFFVKGGVARAEGIPLTGADLQGKLLGHFDPSQIPPLDQRTAGVVGSPGVFLKWMIDENLGARHHRMLFIEYQPGAKIALHDHTFEEAYFILSGEVQGTLDGERYIAQAGDVVWTGVGCVHAFANVGTEPVRWIETFAPQPPDENVFRFMAEWEQRAKDIEG